MYELCYVATTVGLFGALTMLLTIDSLFFGMTLYTVALYDELMHVFNAVEINTGIISTRERYRKLCKSVELHIILLE